MAQNTDFEIQGHRGCRGLLPENTVAGFIRAIDEGVQTLELDVVISKDKKVVVSHDPFFNPDISINPDGIFISKETKNNLYQLTYKEIKRYDVGKRGNKGFPEQKPMKAYKPLLSKVFKEVEAYLKKKGLPPVKYNIEIKSLPFEYGIFQPEVPEFSNLVYKVISEEVELSRVNIQSFDFNVLKFWHAQIESGKYEKVDLSVLISDRRDNDVQNNIKLLGFTPEIWSPYYTQLNKERVQELHRLGIKVIPWTVNEISDMKALKDMGCDGLITDYPNRAKNL